MDLQEAVSRVADSLGGAEAKRLHEEAAEFVAAILAATVLVDGQLRQEEADFLQRLLDRGDAPGTFQGNVSEWASKWPAIRAATPTFFALAAERDPDAAREMLRMIQLIGNNAAVADSQFGRAEHRLVKECIAALEETLSPPGLS